MDTVARKTELQAAKKAVDREVAGLRIVIRIAKAFGFDALVRRLEATLDRRTRRAGLIGDVLNLFDRLDEAEVVLAADGFPGFPPEAIPPDEYAAVLEVQAQINAIVAIFSAEESATVLTGIFGDPRPKQAT